MAAREFPVGKGRREKKSPAARQNVYMLAAMPRLLHPMAPDVLVSAATPSPFAHHRIPHSCNRWRVTVFRNDMRKTERKIGPPGNPGGPCDYRVMVSVAFGRIYPLSPAGQTA